MKKLLISTILILLSFNTFSFAFIDTEAETAIVIDALTGQILYEKNKDVKNYPASMTKIMTVLIIFEKLQNGTLTLDDKFIVSDKAWKEREGSSMFVEVDDEIRVEDLLRGIIIQSGNDACIVVAENIAGSEKSFSIIMNSMVKEIGLSNTNFTNSTGMHDKDNYSTVYDMALISQHLINNYPEYYHLFSETEFEWEGIKQKNRNPLLYKKMGVDGLKTGYLSASGYGLAASATEGDRRLISVTHGFSSSLKRSQGSSRLLTWAFREFENVLLNENSTVVGSIKIPSAKDKLTELASFKDIIITVPKSLKDKFATKIIINDNISAPINNGTSVAKLVVSIPNYDDQLFDLYAIEDVKEAGFFRRILNFVISFFANLLSTIFS